jgi:uncharacterized protein involved in propanediol utilization
VTLTTPASVVADGVAEGIGTSFGTFGELLQGVLPGGMHFMVTSPIAAWSTVTFRHCPDRDQVTVQPCHKRKSALMAQLALDAVGRRGGGEMWVTSELPEGKGLASSSADLVATVRAVGNALGVWFDDEEILSMLARIEPSDGVMYDEIVAFHHVEVRLAERFGTLPAYTIVGHDEGGQVDTISYNRTLAEVSIAEMHEYKRLLAEIRHAIRSDDISTVGRVSTRSAELSARRNPRRHLADLKRICREVDGAGVVCAHSGTVLGVLLPSDDPQLNDKIDAVRTACAALPGSTAVYQSLTSPGGADWRHGRCNAA